MGFVSLTSGMPQGRGRVSVYAPNGLPFGRPPIPPQRGRKKPQDRVSRQGSAANTNSGSMLDNALSQLDTDPGVQAAQQKRAQKQQTNDAWNNASIWDKIGITAGKALAPLDYMSYLRRTIQTGLLEGEEFLTEGKDTPHWMRWLTVKPEQMNTFTPAEEVRAGRSNWDLIQGKKGTYKGKEKAALGFGGMVQDLPSGPQGRLIPFWKDSPTVGLGDIVDTAIGAIGDIGMDPFTRGTTTATRAVNPAELATQLAERKATAANTAIEDLQKLLSRTAEHPLGVASEIDKAQGISRTQQLLHQADEAAGIAKETPEGIRHVPLPKGRSARALWAAEVKANTPELFAQYEDDILKGARSGLGNMSKEAKDALGVSRNGIGIRGGMLGTSHDIARIPGTGAIGDVAAKAGALTRGISNALPAASRWRDPEGLSQALDVFTRGKPGDTGVSAARLMAENDRRLGTGMMRQQGGSAVRAFARQELKPLRSQGREAVDAAVHEAETVGNTPLNKIFQNILETYTKITGQAIDPAFLQDQSTYIPHKLTTPFKRFLKKNAADESVKGFLDQSGFLTEDLLGQAQAIGHKRGFLPGGTYELGGRSFQLTDGSIQDLNEQLTKVFPEFKGSFYETDPAVLLESYLTSRAKEAGMNLALSNLASNPAFHEEVRRIGGPLYDELVARNAALKNDPLQSLVQNPYDQQATASYAQDYLGAGRGPTDEAAVGPRLPETPTRTAADVRRGPPLPNRYVDPAETIFRSVEDPAATHAAQNVFRDQGDSYAQQVMDRSVPPDWRQQARTGQKATMAELRTGFRDLRQNVMYGLRKSPVLDKGPIQEVAKLIRNAKQSVRNWTLKAEGSTATLERIFNETELDIANLQDELARKVDDAGNMVTDANAKVRKDLESKLRQLREVRKEAEEKLNTAPARMRQEARERTATLFKDVYAARKQVKAVEDELFAVEGASARQVDNANKVIAEKAGSTFDEDTRRLAELEGIVKPQGPAQEVEITQKFTAGKRGAQKSGGWDVVIDGDHMGTFPTKREAKAAAEQLSGKPTAEQLKEYRSLKSKFTQKGEHGAETKARDIIDKHLAEQKRLKPKMDAALQARDQAISIAQQRHESVVMGAAEPLMTPGVIEPGTAVPPELRAPTEMGAGEVPRPEQTPILDPEGNPVTQRPQISGPVGPDQPHLADEMTGFGVGEERQVLPRGQESQAAQDVAERAEQVRRRQAFDPSLPKPAGRTEREAIESLNIEAKGVAKGEANPLKATVDSIDRALAVTGQELKPGAISQAPEVVDAMAAYHKAVAEGADEFEAGVAAQQAIADQAAKVDAAVKVGVDQRIAQVQPLEERKAELIAKREYHVVERKQVQKELAALGKDAKPSRYANLTELKQVYDDLEMIGWANPQIQDAAMAQTEQQLNDMADKLHSAVASEMTAAHVRSIVRSAYNGQLAPVMQSSLASGWRMLRTDTKIPGLGDIAVRQTLADQLTNLYQTIDDPKGFGRAFTAMTNFFKTYATLSPGFHVRNALSAIFMNTADGVKFANQIRGVAIWSELTSVSKTDRGAEWLAKQSAEVRQALHAVTSTGAGGRFGEAGFAEKTSGAGKLWNWLNANGATKLSQNVGQWVEGGVRMGMALDSIQRGDSVAQAIERITRIHFDYGQLSKMDSSARLIVPFWTYYSRNLPLQIQMMWTQPRAYSQFQSVMAATPPREQYTPDYWDVPGNWNTAKQVPGGTLYGNLDLPFTRASEQIQDIVKLAQGDPKGILSQANPVATAPAEWYLGQDFYTGQKYDRNNFGDYSQVSGPLGVPVNALARLLGQQKGGKTYEPFTNSLLSLLPMLDRSSRIAPQLLDTGHQAKEPAWASQARFAGIPIRVLTEDAKKTQRASQYYDTKDQLSMQRAIAQYLAEQQAK